LLNLLSNAVKFTDHGEVKLTVSCVGGHSDCIQMVVSDTGVGIPVERQSSIFDAFTQADGSTTRRFGGTGLGLTICRELAHLMNGSIELQSEMGKGSVFSVKLRLPATHSDAEDHSAIHVRKGMLPQGLTILPARAMRVLLVEDNAVNARIARLLVERAGHTVEHVTDGKEAVDAMEASRYDLVLMDLQMPGMDGFEATHIQRSKEKITGKYVPIIALTANAMKGDEGECLRAGMDGYLTKPLNFAHLQDVLSRYGAPTAQS
jgi:CheY-like chemotaxis protein